MISEERLELLAELHAPPVHPDYLSCDSWVEFARAIEREVLKEVKVQIPTATMEQEFAWHQRQGFIRGHKQGQEAMLERVFQINDCEAIRNLEIEEPK